MFVLFKVWEVRRFETAKKPTVEWRVVVKSGSKWECERYVDKNPEFKSALTVRYEIEEA